ncbi:MAG: hypothetical protein KGL44_06000 [Sphingomonadales bacterium]|nr:hypothetical protein [Sphingomonadales bacterium]
MNRFILTLLALLTGLAAQIAPAEARMSGLSTTEIGAVEEARGISRGSAGQSSAVEGSAAIPLPRERDVFRPRPVRPKVFIPSVQFGVDRALE